MTIYTTLSSPLGEITLQANDLGLLGIWFETCTSKPAQLGQYQTASPLLIACCQQLNEYFAGIRQAFELPLAAIGTDFQQQVWQVLRSIPYGETFCYQQVAEAIDNPKAVRAVGLANGKNPLSIIVPCHRVIAKNGKLAGYAGGLARKRALLMLEKRYKTSRSD